MTTLFYQNYLELSFSISTEFGAESTVKEIIENCPISATIIIGGQVVKFIYNEILGWSVQNSLIIVIGEGELLLPAIINGNFVEAPIFEDENKRVFKVDMNSSYFPGDLSGVHLNRSVLKDDVVINHYGEKETSIITSRGCMYNCAFCGGAHNLNKDATIRYRTTADVTKEIADILSANTDITSIRILDDLFLRNKKSISNAVQIFEQFPTLSWRGMAHVLTFIESIEALPRLRESGCRELFLGIESGSERIRKKINKPGTISQIEKVVYALLHTGIDVKGYFMFGFPTETDTEANDTYKLASRLCEIARNEKGRLRFSVFQFRPYHGTQLYNEIIQSGQTISAIKSNEALNVVNRRSQFNFQSGNYSRIGDQALVDFILKTQNLTEVPHD